jgi:hypothetical protein
MKRRDILIQQEPQHLASLRCEDNLFGRQPGGVLKRGSNVFGVELRVRRQNFGGRFPRCEFLENQVDRDSRTGEHALPIMTSDRISIRFGSSTSPIYQR